MLLKGCNPWTESYTYVSCPVFLYIVIDRTLKHLKSTLDIANSSASARRRLSQIFTSVSLWVSFASGDTAGEEHVRAALAGGTFFLLFYFFIILMWICSGTTDVGWREVEVSLPLLAGRWDRKWTQRCEDFKVQEGEKFQLLSAVPVHHPCLRERRAVQMKRAHEGGWWRNGRRGESLIIVRN